jgi:quinol monooxygenase YgiN
VPTSIIKVKIKDGRTAEFETMIKELVATVNANEPGVRFYQIFGAGEPGRYCFLESFADDAAVKAHLKSEHFQAARPTLVDFFDGPPDIQRLSDL